MRCSIMIFSLLLDKARLKLENFVSLKDFLEGFVFVSEVFNKNQNNQHWESLGYSVTESL